MRSFIYFSFVLISGVLLLQACGAQPEEPKSLPVALYEPFAIEYYEFKTEPDSALVIHFNREMDEQDLPVCVDLTMNGFRYYGFFKMFIRKTENKQLVLKRPFYNYPFISALSTKEEVQDFEDHLFKYVAKPKYRARIGIWAQDDAARMFGSEINVDSALTPGVDDFLTFGQRHIHTGEKFDIRKSSRLSCQDLLRFYEGEFDALGKKQGKWTWRYSNGNLLAQTEFVDDSIVSGLKIWGFMGTLIESIPSGDRLLRYSTYYAPGTGPM